MPTKHSQQANEAYPTMSVIQAQSNRIGLPCNLTQQNNSMSKSCVKKQNKKSYQLIIARQQATLGIHKYPMINKYTPVYILP